MACVKFVVAFPMPKDILTQERASIARSSARSSVPQLSLGNFERCPC